MSRILIDGYEAGDLSLCSAVSDAVCSASPPAGMTGSYCLQIPYTGGDYAQYSISSLTELYCAFKYRPTESLSAAKSVVCFFSGGTAQDMLTMSANTGVLEFRRGTTVVATGTALSIGTTYLIEVYIKIDDTAGRFVVKKNGVTDIDFTGDTRNGTPTDITIVRFGAYSSSYYGYGYYDDIVLDTASWIGNTKIQAIVATGTGNSTQWTPSAGANWECGDEKPASDVDYVETGTSDYLDLYAMGNLTGSIETVNCIQIQARAMKEGVTPTQLKLAVRTASTDYVSANKAVPTAYGPVFNIWEVNPNTSVAWLTSDVDGLEAGMKSAA